jgi:hypothetical protein
VDISVTNPISQITKPFYEIPSDIAAVLIHAGIARPIAKAASAPGPSWRVGHPPNGAADRWVLIWADGSGSTMYFDGPPDSYFKNPPVWCGLACPVEVLQTYKRTKDAGGVPNVCLTDAQKNADADRQYRERQHTAGFTRG